MLPVVQNVMILYIYTYIFSHLIHPTILKVVLRAYIFTDEGTKMYRAVSDRSNCFPRLYFFYFLTLVSYVLQVIHLLGFVSCVSIPHFTITELKGMN